MKKLNSLNKAIVKKMIKNNIFSENIHPTIEIDEKKLILTAKKIIEFYLNDKKIFAKSCLINHKFNTLSFDILYCDNKKTHQINKEYRQKDYPADIITFAIFADSEDKFIFEKEINLGEIIISLDKASEAAEAKKNSLNDEINFLISHGIMHLLGFDHQTEEEYNFIIHSQQNALKTIKE